MNLTQKTHEESVSICESPYVIDVPPFVAHLLTAIEDVVFVEIFDTSIMLLNFQNLEKLLKMEKKSKLIFLL